MADISVSVVYTQDPVNRVPYWSTTALTGVTLYGELKFLRTRHEGMCESGGIDPFIPNLGNTCK